MKSNIRKKVLWVGLVLATMGNAPVASADGLYFSSTGAVTVGSMFSIDLLGDFTELAGGTVDLGYNGNKIQINSVTVDPSWEFLWPRNGSLTATGTSSVWSGIGFDTFGAPRSGTAIGIATISLTALAAGNPELHVRGTSETYDSIQLLSPTLGTASIAVAAVPVPPAVWLFASGLLGLVGVARRRTRSGK